MRKATFESPANLAYGDHLGEERLRSVLCAYLRRARGVIAEPGQIVLFSGISDALATIIPSLGLASVAMEDPGLPYFRAIVGSVGAKVVPLPVDEEGALGDPGGVDAALLTPAHQYPLGMTLTPMRRESLIEWARAHHALLIEDDYDGEFRFEREPVHALQGLAPQHVIYLGTASKSLAPGLRIAWAVVPDRFLRQLSPLRQCRQTVPSLDQLALAEFIESGGFDRHLRRCRAVYRTRRDELERAVEGIGGGYHLRGVAAGLHALVELPARGPDEKRLRAEAERFSLTFDTLTAHWQGHRRFEGIIVGYSRPPNHGWDMALGSLCSALQSALV
jgi:GntR family transcriptional regulator/MocR family aminotransferase